MTKEDLRLAMKKQRAALAADPPAYARRSTAVQRTLLASPLWRQAVCIFAYSPVRGEVDTALLLQEAWADGKTVLMPRCLPQSPGHMDMVPCACADDLTPAAFGIPEPGPHLLPAAGPWPPNSLALVPGLAFDLARYRLGYGGGYYDRFFAVWPGLARVGLAFDFQLLDEIPHELWDQPLNHICTEDCLC